MQQIIAFIKPHKLSEVTLALHRVPGLPGLSVSHVRGFGHGGMNPERAERAAEVDELHETARLEVFCPDHLTATIVDAIAHHARTGLGGDGEIYVCPVGQSVRISTGERRQADA